MNSEKIKEFFKRNWPKFVVGTVIIGGAVIGALVMLAKASGEDEEMKEIGDETLDNEEPATEVVE